MADRPFAGNDINQRFLQLAQTYVDPALRPKGALESYGAGEGIPWPWKDKKEQAGISDMLPEEGYIRDLLKEIFMNKMYSKPSPKPKEKKPTGRVIKDYVSDRNDVIENF